MAVCWERAGCGPAAGSHHRLTRTANYGEPPEDMCEADLCAALAEEYRQMNAGQDAPITWEQLSAALGGACQAIWAAYCERSSEADHKERTAPERSKGTVLTLRRGHPTPGPEVNSQPTVRERRLRRLGRRAEELAKQRSRGRPDTRLQSRLTEEARRLGAPAKAREEAEEERLVHWAK